MAVVMPVPAMVVMVIMTMVMVVMAMLVMMMMTMIIVVMMIVCMVVMRMASKQVNVAVAALPLTDKIKNSKRNQRAAGQKWKHVANTAINCHSAPDH